MLKFIFFALLLAFVIWLTFGSRRKHNGVGGFLSRRHISGLDGSDYLIRRYLLPRNNFLNIYLHNFLGSDDDRALHDHPWYSASLVLKGELIEHLPRNRCRVIRAGMMSFRSPLLQHRIELPTGQKAITLFITGPVVRKWGFACPKGWVSWEQYGSNSGCE